MKIAIPVDENSLESAVCVSFGRAPYFMLYDTESKEAIFHKNAAAEAEGGAGLKAAQFIVDSKADVLLTVRCGQNAADVLNAADIKTYKTIKKGAEENIVDFEAEKLAVMTQFHAGFHGHQ
ncbi:MAG: NifB/NifX family molybdenum-iron cluster-binding protein [Hydrogenoanaerobacterium sp.]